MNDKHNSGNDISGDYSRYREKWVHEDHLINHRLNWLIMTQTILFAAYGLLISVKVQNPESRYLNNIESVITTLPAIGIAVSALILLGIIGAVGAMFELRKNRTAQVETMDVDAALWTTILGQITGLLMPAVFITGWLWVK